MRAAAQKNGSQAGTPVFTLRSAVVVLLPASVGRPCPCAALPCLPSLLPSRVEATGVVWAPPSFPGFPKPPDLAPASPEQQKERLGTRFPLLDPRPLFLFVLALGHRIRASFTLLSPPVAVSRPVPPPSLRHVSHPLLPPVTLSTTHMPPSSYLSFSVSQLYYTQGLLTTPLSPRHPRSQASGPFLTVEVPCPDGLLLLLISQPAMVQVQGSTAHPQHPDAAALVPAVGGALPVVVAGGASPAR